MKKLSPWRNCIFVGVIIFGFYVADCNRLIIGWVIAFLGLLIYIAIPPKKPLLQDAVMINYGGKELKFHLYDGTHIRGKVVRADDKEIIQGFVLLRNAHILCREDDEGVIPGDEYASEEYEKIYVDVAEIQIISYQDMDKVSR